MDIEGWIQNLSHERIQRETIKIGIQSDDTYIIWKQMETKGLQWKSKLGYNGNRNLDTMDTDTM
jgi:hypothetical protein